MAPSWGGTAPAGRDIIRVEDPAVPEATLTAPNTLADLADLVRRAEGFPPVLDALKQGHSGTVDGAWGSSAALVAAALAEETPQTLLVVLAHPRDVDGWLGDLLSFTGRQPVVFPAWDNQPGSGPFDEVAGQRLRL